jgi:cytochrome c peroxidase
MKTLVAVLAVALAACSSKKSGSEQGSGTGSSGGPSGPVAEPPSTLPQPPMPKLTLADDPKRAEKIALGNALFFDKRLSGASDLSCYDCHKNEDGNGGHDPLAVGSGGKKLPRHSPVIWNVGYWNNAFYWDGRAKTLEDNVKGAWGGGNMGGAPADAKPEDVVAALDKRAADLAAIGGYKKLFEAAYPGTPIKAEHAIGAIAEYMRTMVCNDTKFDKFAGGDKAALSEQEKRGLDLFLMPSKGNCLLCHSPPFFSSGMGREGGAYFNVGIGTRDASGAELPADKVDIGRMKVSKQEVDWAAFKVPSLRNVSKSAPYFHDGSVAKLEDAVKLMATGGIANKNKFALLEDRKLSAAELTDIVAFLGALECPNKLEAPKEMP